MKRLTDRQRVVLHEMAQHHGEWYDPPRGYNHHTWDMPDFPVSKLRGIFWALCQKEYVSFDSYAARDTGRRVFRITDLGKHLVAAMLTE